MAERRYPPPIIKPVCRCAGEVDEPTDQSDDLKLLTPRGKPAVVDKQAYKYGSVEDGEDILEAPIQEMKEPVESQTKGKSKAKLREMAEMPVNRGGRPDLLRLYDDEVITVVEKAAHNQTKNPRDVVKKFYEPYQKKIKNKLSNVKKAKGTKEKSKSSLGQYIKKITSLRCIKITMLAIFLIFLGINFMTFLNLFGTV